MAALVPLQLVLLGGVLCAWAERAVLEERWYTALVTAPPGIALMAMGVVVMPLGLLPPETTP